MHILHHEVCLEGKKKTCKATGKMYGVPHDLGHDMSGMLAVVNGQESFVCLSLPGDANAAIHQLHGACALCTLYVLRSIRHIRKLSRGRTVGVVAYA